MEKDDEQIFTIHAVIFMGTGGRRENAFTILPIQSLDFFEWAPKTRIGSMPLHLSRLQKWTFRVWCKDGEYPSLGENLFRKCGDDVYWVKHLPDHTYHHSDKRTNSTDDLLARPPK